MTDNKYIGLFGEYQRRTGYLAYFSLIIFFVASSYIFRLTNIFKLEFTLIVVGFIVGIYGIFQHYNQDFIHWNNPYNSVISTLGNPDFAAAAMSLFLIISFGVAVQEKISIRLKISAGINVLFLFLVIQYSQVRQGFITSIAGITIIIIVWIHQRQKYLAYGLTFFSICVSTLAIFGMLNKGPFVRYFYKPSVTFRGDYWRAGWNMFTHHPFFGVGLDRYGSYFRQYRDATQSLRRGPGLVSNAAHDIPIQLAATGGVFVLAAYLAFIIFVIWRAKIALKKTAGVEQIVVATIFAAWAAYEAQSLISIDNLAIAIWGYVLAGAIVGISTTQNEIKVFSKNMSMAQPLFSASLSLIMVLTSSLFFRAEASMHRLNAAPIPRTQSELTTYQALLKMPLSYVFQEPSFKLATIQIRARLGDITGAEIELQKIISQDPKNFLAIDFLAQVYENEKKWDQAIRTREHEARLDPYNQIVLLQLGEDYKNSGDHQKAFKVIAKINTFAPNSLEAIRALKDFGSFK